MTGSHGEPFQPPLGRGQKSLKTADTREARHDSLTATWAQIEDLKTDLLAVNGALVWVDPIDADGHSRGPLDAMLRDVASAGVFVSAHPDVILKLGTKDVLVETRDLGWAAIATGSMTWRNCAPISPSASAAE
ncbi:MAG: hypothetical protein ABI330_13850 [Caldimonas sp.]